ncbi:MAG: tetratricopeptide repeat protein [Pyrinomonadaceae bacterium]
MLMRLVTVELFLVVILSFLAGCHQGNNDTAQAKLSASDSPTIDSCAVALAPHAGEGRLDQEIARLQQKAQTTTDPTHELEKLGWVFVSKARLSNDSGYYKLAEQCALCLEVKHPESPEALLLRGHVLHSLHRFKEAETLARTLVARRETSFDYGLLGDALMEQGRLTEAAGAYQKMVDLRPDLQSYSRAAHLRWLKGDLSGALELIRMAARASSPRDADAAAWVYTRLALYEFQAGEREKAFGATDAALALKSDYAPALLARGRILMVEGKSDAAIEALERAAKLNPLPEYQWAFAEALEVAGRADEARLVEAQLMQRGAAADPRTFALYLATRGERAETALKLAEQELKEREDVFTLDALAWSLAASGKAKEASSYMKRALAEETEDARLFYHAGMIAAKIGQVKEARHWFNKAASIRQMLLPSEREQLARQRAAL